MIAYKLLVLKSISGSRCEAYEINMSSPVVLVYTPGLSANV